MNPLNPSLDNAGTTLMRIKASDAVLGEGMHIRRALPTRLRRMVGAWCFLDHFGPADVRQGAGMRVGPHPHTGLQTVTWLLQGEILHRDSLGSVQPIVPGQLNLMTSGRAISHSEESPAQRPPQMHGLQFWIALPESARHIEPVFEHYPSLPRVAFGGFEVTVLIGEALGERSPARIHSPLVGLDLAASGASSVQLPLRRDFEYAALVAEGEAVIEGEVLAPGTLLYLGQGRSTLQVDTQAAVRLVLIGGEPFAESILMWWNFVARSKAEVLAACREWNEQGGDFGEVHGYDGAHLVAPMPPWHE